MKLNFFTFEFPLGSWESYIENEILILSKNFDEIRIFPHYFKKDKIERKLKENCNTIQLGDFQNVSLNLKFNLLIIRFFFYELLNSNNKYFYIKYFKKWLSLLKVAAKKAKYIEDNNLLLNDSVNYSFWMNDWALVLTFLKKRKSIKCFVFRCGGFDIWNERHDGGYLPFRALIYKYAAQVYPNSKTAAKYIKDLKVQPQKIIPKYLGTADRGEGKFSKSDLFTIVSVSDVIPLKRVELIVETLKLVRKKIRWVHFGEGLDKEEIISQASKYLKHHEVVFKGRESDLFEFYKNNTVNLFFMTSSTEGLPVSIQEALSFGIPIIATNVGGVSEIVNPKTGVLIEKDYNLKNVADIITNWNQSEFNTLAKRNEIREFWRQNFSASKVYNDFSKELKNI